MHHSYPTKLFVLALLGISSGLPLFVILSTIPIWLRESGVDLATIGLIQLTGMPYTFKFLWAPLFDRYRAPVLTLRRGWILLCQLFLFAVFLAFGGFDPVAQLNTIVVLMLLLAFFSATQDIVIDAHRREFLSDDEMGGGTGFFIIFYRLSQFVGVSLPLVLAEHLGWRIAFGSIGLAMLLGMITTLMMPEYAVQRKKLATLTQTLVNPFKDFLTRFKPQDFMFLLLFILLYKLGDSMATALASPFYYDMGYSKDDIGVITKIAGLSFFLIGAFVAGVVMKKISINQSLWIFGVVQMVTILGFVWLSLLGQPDNAVLFIVVALENLGVGLGTVALLSFMSVHTNKLYTAAQFALLTAITAIPRTFLNATTGFIIEAVGYTQFFLICTALAIPGMLLLFKVAPWSAPNPASEPAE